MKKMNLETFNNEGISEIRRLCAKFGLSPMELAYHLQVTKVRIYEIMAGKRRITPETDIFLCHFFNLEKGYFASLQTTYDLQLEERRLSDKLKKLKTIKEIVRA